jgi:superfamily II DNA or RNA helicase
MVYRSSFSQHNKFEHFPRQWFYEKILKIPYISDMCYADAGNVIHHTIQAYYEKKVNTIAEAKVYFNDEWNKFNLDGTKVAMDKDAYWLMFLNAISLKKKISKCEFKYETLEYLGFIDAVNTEDDELYDWKTSHRRAENEAEYKSQLELYSWIYYKVFGKVPKKCTVYYLRYNGTKGELTFIPTLDDVKKKEEWYYKILKEMEMHAATMKIPDKCFTCNQYCPYVNICAKDDGKLVYEITIQRNEFFINGPIDKILNAGFNKKFSYTLKNAFHMKRSNPNARTEVKFWNIASRKLLLGFLDGVKLLLEDYAKHKNMPLTINIIDKRIFNSEKVPMPDKFVNGRELRDYQLEAVDKYLQNKISILELTTGAGKTEIAIEIIRRLGYRTLFVVDKIELLKQTKERIEKALGIEVGQIGRGVMEVKPITVATIQTLNKHCETLREYLAGVRLVIFDECHKVAADSYLKLSHYLIGTEYRLGISGTAYRDDKNDMKIYAATGYIVHQVKADQLISDGWLMKPKITFISNYLRDSAYTSLELASRGDSFNPTLNYVKYYDNFIMNNTVRNNLVRQLANKYSNKKVLIIVKRIEHGNYLESIVPGSKYLHGSTPKTERDQMFDEFSKGNLNILVSTISIFAEGIDIPALEVVINACGNRGDVKTIQVLGRIIRKMDGKTNAQYIDFLDYSKFFKFASISRMRALKREGHTVNVVDLHANDKGETMGWEDDEDTDDNDIEEELEEEE